MPLLISQAHLLLCWDACDMSCSDAWRCTCCSCCCREFRRRGVRMRRALLLSFLLCVQKSGWPSPDLSLLQAAVARGASREDSAAWVSGAEVVSRLTLYFLSSCSLRQTDTRMTALSLRLSPPLSLSRLLIHSWFRVILPLSSLQFTIYTFFPRSNAPCAKCGSRFWENN